MNAAFDSEVGTAGLSPLRNPTNDAYWTHWPHRSYRSHPTAIHIEAIYLSPDHNFFGRYGKSPCDHEIVSVPHADAVSGRGLRGDRFFGYKPNYKGQLTLFSREVFDQLCTELGVPNAGSAALRRNIVVSGVDLNALIGREFSLQGVRLFGVEECRPCSWMNLAIAPGAEEWLQGRGGLRCRILSDGRLVRNRNLDARLAGRAGPP